MGKAKKHSRGMRAIEPDDFGYPRGTDSEMEEEAPVRKRSRVSLNGGDRYGVPKEVLSLSNMLRSEREHLVHRLRMELEQVRELSKRIACISSDRVMLSPYSDPHSCSDGSRKMATQGKKRRPLRNDKQQSQKGPCRHATSSTVASLMKECQTLLDRLWSHKLGFPFRIPVDPVLLNIPDYFTVVKHPMDLGTIRSRLRNGEYSSPLDFAEDVRLTFSNAMAYNPPGNQYHKMARDLNAYFETRWKTIEKKIPVMEPPVMSLTSSASLESEIPYNVGPPRKNTAVAVNESKLKVEPAKLVMTDDEKKKLSQDLDALEEEFPQNIIDLLKEQLAGNDDLSGEVEIEIDIETLSDETLFMVRKLLDDYLKDKKKSQEKSEHCEMEIAHHSGFSNSTLQPSKGDLLIDEDVDIIGGNDPPVSSHPPQKIEKDAACGNNECSSSSSSSRESGSSSSDSDSCSSSRSETDTKASNPTSTEDKKEQGVDINGEKIVVNDSLNELSQVEHDVGEKSNAMDAVHLIPEEEMAPLERQESPGKRQRAALLKSRFADTIMKAREKTLTKGEKGDAEKLRIEREKFEKRLKEENLRLQAEAKAAEEARRKAKVEAAEKVRREREQEREAARQALQKLEKTVEIDEGRRFMEDLEMLRATGVEGDQLPTFMDEMSPTKFSEDMLGSFKMEGSSNPLEQLGLYMKRDEDEDDEEDEPHVSQGEVDEQAVDGKERVTVSPRGVEREDKLDKESEGPLSHDSGNQEDETLINQKEGEEEIENVAVSPHGEEGEDQLCSGSEGREQVAQDNGNHEDEKLINENEGREPLDFVPEQENGVEDKGDEEVEVVDKGDEEAEVVDMGEEETEGVDMVKVETEVGHMIEKETEVVDNGEKENEVVDMGELENGIENKGDEEAGIVDMGGEETEDVEMVKVDTEVVDMREKETEAADMGEQGNETGDMGGEQKTEVFDNGEEETEVMGKGEEVSEAVHKREEETEVVEEGQEESEAVHKREEETEVVEKGEQVSEGVEEETE